MVRRFQHDVAATNCRILKQLGTKLLIQNDFLRREHDLQRHTAMYAQNE